MRAWLGGALFSAWRDWSFISKLERWFSGCSRTGWCCLASTSLNPRRLAKPPRVSPLHDKFLGFFSSSHQGEERARIPAEFRARILKPVTGKETGSSRLQRSFERGNASRPPAVVDSLAALAFDEAALRPPAVVDSLAALAFNKAWRRACGSLQPTRRDPRSRAGGLTTYCLLHSKECERDRTNSPGLSLHGRPGGRRCGDCVRSTP